MGDYDLIRIDAGTVVEITVPMTQNRLNQVIKEAFPGMSQEKVCVGTVNGVLTMVSF